MKAEILKIKSEKPRQARAFFAAHGFLVYPPAQDGSFLVEANALQWKALTGDNLDDLSESSFPADLSINLKL